VPNDTNNDVDIFLRDTVAHTTERINLTAAGGEPVRGVQATFLSISADGQFVAFDSSYDLVVPPTGQFAHVRSFLRDRTAGATIRLPGNSPDGNSDNMGSGGAQISADGRYLAYSTYIAPVPAPAQAAWGVYLLDRQTNASTLVSQPPGGAYPNDGSWYPAISADGRFVAFYSYASNLVPGDTNNVADIFRWDHVTNALDRVNPAADGGQANAHSSDVGISGDGRFVIFATLASNLVHGDTNNANDIFMRGPLPSSDPPYTVADVRGAVRIAGGLAQADAIALRRLNVTLVEAGPNSIDWQDAVQIARKVSGLEPNP
jgi:hypothetical protein